MNVFRQGIQQAKTISTIALSLTSASLVGASVLMPDAAPEFRVFVGGTGIAAGAIASIAQKEQQTWQQTFNHLELSANTLLVSGCVSLVCAAAIPNEMQYRPLDRLAIASGVIALGCAKKSAIAAASIAGLAEEEMAKGFGEVFDSVAKPPEPQQIKQPALTPQLPLSQSRPIAPQPKPAPQPAVQPQPTERAIAVVEDRVIEPAPTPVEVVEQEQRQEQSIEDTKIELIASELLSAFARFRFTKVQWLGAIVSPNFIRCLIEPGDGVSVTSLQKIALDLGRILHLENPLYPNEPVIPLIGQQPGAVTVDILRSDRQTIYFSQYFPAQPNFVNPPGLKLAIGVDIKGNLIYIDLSDTNTPHVLIGGTTGSGKSGTLRLMLASGIWCYSPEALQFTIIDVKRVTFSEFENTAHVKQVIKEIPESIAVLEEAVKEMDDRYKLFEEIGEQNIDDYCRATGKIMPRHVIAIDEFYDFMSDKEIKPKLEQLIGRLGAVARGAGIHLIAGTQRPEANVVTPLIRSNLPAIIGLKVGRDKDSAIVFGLDGYKDLYYLLGRGDLIYNQGFQRLQSPFFDLGDYLKKNKISKPPQENLLDRHFTDKVEFVANERERFEKFRLSLPTHPGVYCVSDGLTIYYVGYAKNVARRWMRSDKKHHWLPAIFELINQGKKVFIYSKIVTSGVEQAERDLIEKLQPKWNGKDPIREVREMRQHQPIASRLLPKQIMPKPRIEVTEEEKQKILDCKKRGLNQDEAIREIWGVSKSGTDRRYKLCRDKYQFVASSKV